jgi:hypothetical protein
LEALGAGYFNNFCHSGDKCIHYPPHNPPFYKLEYCKEGSEAEVMVQDDPTYRTCIKDATCDVLSKLLDQRYGTVCQDALYHLIIIHARSRDLLTFPLKCTGVISEPFGSMTKHVQYENSMQSFSFCAHPFYGDLHGESSHNIYLRSADLSQSVCPSG